jgi:probable rRNA maturation factor
MSHLKVTVVDGLGRPATPALARWLARAAPGAARGRVTVALVSDATMCRLNREFRGIDAATDVLSFPAERQGRRHVRNLRQNGPKSLGDIAIATGVARRQARQCRHSTATELRVLALHGLLHLLGYDHITDRGQMERVEERLRRRAGLTRGLISRVARPRRSRQTP